MPPYLCAAFNQVSPDEKIFTPTDERGFFPYTPHPTPYTLFQDRTGGKKRVIGQKEAMGCYYLKPIPRKQPN
ncbi:hypothetical protein [Microcystis aeruginosa]|uniref:hypothetical protein n=2 Tax=Microcystis TaxID=1125 RepID=UPI001561CF25|nr:hypothetical protein [Microcystis aeruginosa]